MIARVIQVRQRWRPRDPPLRVMALQTCLESTPSLQLRVTQQRYHQRMSNNRERQLPQHRLLVLEDLPTPGVSFLISQAIKVVMQMK
jgi:hypothetical protein